MKIKINGVELFLLKTFANLIVCFPVSYFYKLLWNHICVMMFSFINECSWTQSYFVTFLLICFGVGIRIRFDDIKDIDDDHNSTCALKMTLEIK